MRVAGTASARVACHLSRSGQALDAVLAGGHRSADALAQPPCASLLGVWVGEMCGWLVTCHESGGLKKMFRIPLDLLLIVLSTMTCPCTELLHFPAQSGGGFFQLVVFFETELSKNGWRSNRKLKSMYSTMEQLLALLWKGSRQSCADDEDTAGKVLESPCI